MTRPNTPEADKSLPNYGKAVLPAWANGRRFTPPKSWQTTPGSSRYGRLLV